MDCSLHIEMVFTGCREKTRDVQVLSGFVCVYLFIFILIKIWLWRYWFKRWIFINIPLSRSEESTWVISEYFCKPQVWNKTSPDLAKILLFSDKVSDSFMLQLDTLRLREHLETFCVCFFSVSTLIPLFFVCLWLNKLGNYKWMFSCAIFHFANS